MLRLAAAVSLALCCLAAAPAGADDQFGFRVYQKKAGFADVRDDLRAAIEKRGFVIDYTGKLNQMLERTAEVSGSVTATGVKSPYAEAEFVQFCPSRLTHEAVSANALAIINCPVAMQVFQLAGRDQPVSVGFRHPLDSPSKAVKKVNEKLLGLLDEIAREATR